MAFPIIPKVRSGSPGSPTSLFVGELAVNTHDGTLFLGADAGVVQIGTPISASGADITEWTANGTATQFAPINGYNGTSANGYFVTVQGIDQPFTVTSANSGTVVFDTAPPAGSLVRVRALTAGQSGGGGSGVPATDVQVFSTPGTFTWTKPAGAKSVNVVCIGGGEGGEGGQSSDPDPAYGGKGGDGGGYSERTINAADLGATVAVVVGNGGSGSAFASQSPGGLGENSTFGDVCIAYGGGQNGLSLSPKSLGGARGANTTGDGGNAMNSFAPAGGGGGAGWWSYAQYPTNGGTGGVSVFGNGGNGNPDSCLTPAGNGEWPGGGGGGGGAGSLYLWGGGGNGAAGMVMVTTYF